MVTRCARRRDELVLYIFGVLSLLILSCSHSLVSPSESAPARSGVTVDDLVLEFSNESEGSELEIRAQAAHLDGLPGRGFGHLQKVEVRLRGKQGAPVKATASSGHLDPSCAIVLEGATLLGPDDMMKVEARSLLLASDGRLFGTDIEARLRVAR